MIKNLNLEDAAGDAIETSDLVAELQSALTDGDWFKQRCERAADVRFCRWDGQSEDGRKHRGANGGREVFPWEGASDVRIRTADEIVNDEVRMMLSSLRRAQFQAAGIGSEDLAQGQRVSQLLRWQIEVAMRDQLRREMELASQWRQHFGSAVTAVQWHQELRRVPQEVRIEDVVATAVAPMMAGVQTEEAAAELQQRGVMEILDPLMEEQWVEFLRQMYPLTKKSEARKALRELRETGLTMLDAAEVFGGGPRWTALQTFVDVFFPVNTWDIQRARWIAHRELVTETELTDRIETEGYDPDWVEQAINRKGSSLVETAGTRFGSGWRSTGWANAFNGTKDLIEIYHFYYKTLTDGGVPQVRKCVLHPGVTDLEGWSGPLPYDHGMYPYVLHQREHTARCILESRGVAELADTWQAEIKAQRDARVDRTSLSTLPPVLVPPTRGAMRLQFGPGVQWPRRKGEDFEWMKTPPFDQGSIEIERATERSIDRYFGRISETNPPDRAMLYQQFLIDGWLGEIEQLAAMTLQLDQQYLPDEIAIRVMNAPVRMSRQEIQGKYDLQVVFDARNLNSELLKEKLELINTFVLPLDRFGAVDLAKMVQMTLGAVDPIMAEAVLQSVEAASEKQVAEEQDVLSKMVAGIEVPMEPQPGMNYGLRMQVLQEAVQKNPELQQMIAGRPVLQKMVQTRMEFLQFQAQQQQNAVTGRIGAQPVLG
jgi:hypothetical protein